MAFRVEDAPSGPLGVYGQTKLNGDCATLTAGGQWAVMRTSWVFSAHGTNFVKTMRRFGAERDRLTIPLQTVLSMTSLCSGRLIWQTIDLEARV